MPFEVKVDEDYQFSSATCLYGMTIPRGVWTEVEKDELRTKAERTHFLEVRDSVTVLIIDPDPDLGKTSDLEEPVPKPLGMISEAAAKLLLSSGLDASEIISKVPGSITVMDVRKALKSKEG